MTADLINLTGRRAPPAPVAESSAAAAIDPLLLCDPGAVEMAVAPEIHVTDLAWLYEVGPCIRLIFATKERPLGEREGDGPLLAVSVKVVMSLAGIERMHAKLGALLAAARATP